jgi:hypothetical protein
MIKISVNANRSDIAGYISYYSCKEIAPLLEIDEKEIIYETAVVDYFAFGDVDFSTKVETIRSRLKMPSNSFSTYRKRLTKKGIVRSPEYGWLSFTLPRFKEFILRQEEIQ